MAEEESKNQPKDIIEPVPEETEKLESEETVTEAPQDSEESDSEKKPEEKKFGRRDYRKDRRDEVNLDAWVPRTKLGKLVKSGKEKDLDKILTTGKKILESEIVDSLLTLESDLILIGQAKGKFGGGKRRAWRQTQKKTMEGNVLSFSSMAVIGDKKGHVGLGSGKSRETLPSREKAVRNAKLNVMKVTLGFESPETDTNRDDPHTIPFKVEGKSGSVRVTLWPAPRGTGLVAGDECKKILKLAGVRDVYSRTTGKTRTTFNLAKAYMDALEKTRRDIK